MSDSFQVKLAKIMNGYADDQNKKKYEHQAAQMSPEAFYNNLIMVKGGCATNSSDTASTRGE